MLKLLNPKISLTHLADLCMSNDLSIYNQSLGYVNPAQYHLINIVTEIRNFWVDEKIKVYKNAVMQVEGSKVHTVLPHNYLLSIYDTIICKYSDIFINDEIIANIENLKSEMSGLALNIREQLKLIPLLKSDYEPPLIAFDLWRF